MRSPQPKRIPKHTQIRDELQRAITSAEYTEGQRVPTEIELATRLGVSRPTVARALRDLEQDGFLRRRPGAGTYVSFAKRETRYVFGLLIWEVGEIFEPICLGLSHAREGTPHELIWGNVPRNLPRGEHAVRLCEQYIKRKVSGVFWAPLELTEQKDEINERIAEAFDLARIPIVLVDRDMYPLPRRSHYDLVGIDNRRAGYVITEHLLNLGCQRVVFAARPNSAPTVDLRIEGYRDALLSRGITPDPQFVQIGDPEDAAFVQGLLEHIHPEAIACANDFTAAQLMRTLTTLGVSLPREIRIVGIDDVKYASLLSVPLTTLRQPCQDIGIAALEAMLERIKHPGMPRRDIMLECQLIIRQSCGATVRGEGESCTCIRNECT